MWSEVGFGFGDEAAVAGWLLLKGDALRFDSWG